MTGMTQDEPVTNNNALPASNTLLPRVISGSVGSIITAIAVTPLEVVKVRQQASLPNDIPHQILTAPMSEAKVFLKSRGIVVLRNGLQLPKSFFPCMVAPGHTDVIGRSTVPLNICPRFYESTFAGSTTQQEPVAPGSTFRMLRYIFYSEGLPGLYTGLRPTLLMSVPNTVLTLSLYDEINIICGSSNTQPYLPLLAGAFARLVASTVTAPLELIRTRQASFNSINGPNGKPPGLVEEFRVLGRNGIQGFYAGLPVTLVRDVSFSSVYFFCLEQFRSNLQDLGGFSSMYNEKSVSRSATVVNNLICGAGAATLATLCTGPFDTAKTRRQMVHKGNNYQTSNDMFGIMRNVYKYEGFAGLWKGNRARLTKVVPSSAIMIAFYELGKDIIKEVFAME
jgi:solute carrier family 25 protein 39/40